MEGKLITGSVGASEIRVNCSDVISGEIFCLFYAGVNGASVDSDPIVELVIGLT